VIAAGHDEGETAINQVSGLPQPIQLSQIVVEFATLNE